ncbi:MAG: hypothetical protein EOO14_16740, partial [Chitinophagaceae bacterium]
MKKVFPLLVLSFAALFIFGLVQARAFYNTIFQQLGLQTEEAESYIDANFISGSTAFPGTPIMVALSLEKREEAVKAIGQYVKAHVQTPAFAKNYEQDRQEQKPVKPEGRDQNAETMAVYQQDLKYWEAEFLATVNGLVKKRLQQFLQETASIDYNAKLARKDRKMVFVDPALEAKDPFWKACFRSGKRTVDAAR